MSIDGERIASDIVGELEKAWNAADGEGFGRAFAEDADAPRPPRKPESEAPPGDTAGDFPAADDDMVSLPGPGKRRPPGLSRPTPSPGQKPPQRPGPEPEPTMAETSAIAIVFPISPPNDR